MKGLTKKERLEQRILELEPLIAKKDYDFDKEQGKRIKRTFLVLSGVIYLIALYYGLENGINGIDIEDILCFLIVPPFVAGCVMFISSMILLHITNGATQKTETIAKLEGELNALKSEKHNNFEDDKIKELERHIDYLENYYAHKCDDCTFLKLLKENTEENE